MAGLCRGGDADADGEARRASPRGWTRRTRVDVGHLQVAAFWTVLSPETPAATESAAAEGGSGVDDSGAQAASRQLFVGEEEGETAAELTLVVDLSGEEHGGEGARRRRRGGRLSHEREGGRGIVPTVLQKGPCFFCNS